MPDTETHAARVRELRDHLRATIVDRDRAAAVSAALDAVHSGDIGVAELYSRVLAPLLVDTGASWQAGTTQVWEEHLASAIVRTIVEALYPEVIRQAGSVPRRGESVLLATPPKELHDLGLRMLADRFELAGYDVTLLGANTPLHEIAAAAQTIHADLVVLSVSTVYERVELRDFLDRLRDQVPGARVLAGGAAFAHDHDWPANELLDLDSLGLASPSQEGPA